MNTERNIRDILDMHVDVTNYAQATRRIVDWARDGSSRYVCAANVHMVMAAYDDPSFRAVVNGADLVTPDGMPLVWALRRLGVPDQTRVYGPDLTLHVCEAAAGEDVPVALYGGTPESLDAFTAFLESNYPGIRIVSTIAPPFRPLTPEEDERYTEEIVSSGARVLFVGIGCPKQERWMAAHQGKITAVMLGVGAAFDFHTGRVRQAPSWMQRIGLEWFFRFMMEPRRLWKRYAQHNPRFLVLLARQLLSKQSAGPAHRHI
jgi:N-acetylglucosaminyldiphosphoundecaprenol N-acetyl-beta-D-mannosaminyltransferase